MRVPLVIELTPLLQSRRGKFNLGERFGTPMAIKRKRWAKYAQRIDQLHRISAKQLHGDWINSHFSTAVSQRPCQAGVRI